MLGGYQIIDLRNIGLELKGTQQTISDVGILKQLHGLRDYIEKGHDYKKALNHSLKPVLIRYRDAKNNEKREVSSFASIVSENSALTIVIESKNLQIEVVFEEKTDDVGNKYYDIKTAKYLYSVNETIDGDLKVEGDLEVEGDLVIAPDSGTIADVLGLDSEGNLVKGTISSGETKLYKHHVEIKESSESTKKIYFDLISLSSSQATTYTALKLLFTNPIQCRDYTSSQFSLCYVTIGANGPDIETAHSVKAMKQTIKSDSSGFDFADMVYSWTSTTSFIFTDTVTEL